MILNDKTLKELKVMARKRQQNECPSYSRMNKQQLIQYLSAFSKSPQRQSEPIDSIELTKKRLSKQRVAKRTPVNWSPVKNEPSNLSDIYLNTPTPVKSIPRHIRKTKKKSDPYYLDKVFKNDERKYKQYPVHIKKPKKTVDMKRKYSKRKGSKRRYSKIKGSNRYRQRVKRKNSKRRYSKNKQRGGSSDKNLLEAFNSLKLENVGDALRPFVSEDSGYNSLEDIKRKYFVLNRQRNAEGVMTNLANEGSGLFFDNYIAGLVDDSTLNEDKVNFAMVFALRVEDLIDKLQVEWRKHSSTHNEIYCEKYPYALGCPMHDDDTDPDDYL